MEDAKKKRSVWDLDLVDGDVDIELGSTLISPDGNMHRLMRMPGVGDVRVWVRMVPKQIRI